MYNLQHVSFHPNQGDKRHKELPLRVKETGKTIKEQDSRYSN